jgi:predicted DNA-binding protein YlxM (UPF0122 family)
MTKDSQSLADRNMLAHLQDLYGELLAPRQRQVLKLRLDEDMSLSEMAEELGTTRQACVDAFRRGVKALERYEKTLGLLESKAVEDEREKTLSRLLRDMDAKNWAVLRGEIMEFLESGKRGPKKRGI